MALKVKPLPDSVSPDPSRLKAPKSLDAHLLPITDSGRGNSAGSRQNSAGFSADRVRRSGSGRSAGRRRAQLPDATGPYQAEEQDVGKFVGLSVWSGQEGWYFGRYMSVRVCELKRKGTGDMLSYVMLQEWVVSPLHKNVTFRLSPKAGLYIWVERRKLA